MKNLKRFVAIGIAGAMMLALAGCSKDAASASNSAQAGTGETASQAADVINKEDMLEMPDGVSLSEDQMKIALSAYAGYMTEALKGEYTVEVRYDNDGSVHFDGSKTEEDGTVVEAPDMNTFDSIEDAFAYLYNIGQIDAEGNLLVSVSSGESETTADGDAAEEATDTEESETVEEEPAEDGADDAEAVSEGESDAAESQEAEQPAGDTVEEPESEDVVEDAPVEDTENVVG